MHFLCSPKACLPKAKPFFFSFYHVNISIIRCLCSWYIIKSPFRITDSTRTSKRSGEDPKICEILVDNVEENDLGAWRSNLLQQKIYIIDCVAWSSKFSRCLVRRKYAKFGGKRQRIDVTETPGIVHTDPALVQHFCELVHLIQGIPLTHSRNVGPQIIRQGSSSDSIRVVI